MQRCRHRDDLVLTNDLCSVRPPSVVAARRDLIYPQPAEEDGGPVGENSGGTLLDDHPPPTEHPLMIDRETRRPRVDYRKYF